MRTAHRMMRRYNIERAAEGGDYRFVHLGTPSGRVQAHHRILAGILGEHFFVQPIWVSAYITHNDSRGRVLEICGRTENLDIAAHVHGFLIETGERLWRDHKRRAGLKGNRDRRRFLQGVMMGFHEQLMEAAQRAEQTGLVWVGDADLDDYLARRHPRRTRGRGVSMHQTDEWRAGRDAGRRIVLRRVVRDRGKGPVGRLLG